MTVFSKGRLAAAVSIALVIALAPLAGTSAAIAADKDAAKPPAAKDAAAKDPVVATVNGDKIMLSELKALHADFPQARVRQIPIARIYKPLLELLVQIKLLSGEARKQGLAKDPAVVERVETYRDRVLRDVYLERFVDKKIDEAALKAAYDEFLKTYKGKEEVRARHILVKEKKEAMAVIEALEKGEKFDELAKAKSIGPSKSRGGDLGWFSKGGRMVKSFVDAAFKLKKGEHTAQPVKTQFGWHVIQVTDRRTKPAPTFDAMKEQLRTQLGRKLAVAELKRLQDDAKIVRFKMDGSPEDPEKKEPEKKAPETKEPEKK